MRLGAYRGRGNRYQNTIMTLSEFFGIVAGVQAAGTCGMPSTRFATHGEGLRILLWKQ